MVALIVALPTFFFDKYSVTFFLLPFSFSCQPSEDNGELDLNLPDDYCGSCFGAKEGCCQTCREVTDAYKAKGWTAQDIRRTAEQVRPATIAAKHQHDADGAGSERANCRFLRFGQM